MDLAEMKASWKKAGTETGNSSIATLLKKNGHLKVVRKVRLKLLIEAVCMALLLFFFYDIFDGDQKPLYASMALVIGALFYFCTNLLAYFALHQAPGELSIRSSLKKLLLKLEQAKAFSLVAMVLFALTLLLFFTSAIELNPEKLLLMGGFLVFVLVQVYLSARMWNARTKKIRQLLEELAE